MAALMNGTGTSASSETEDEPAERPKKQDRFTRMEEGFTEHFASIGVNVMLLGAQSDGQVIMGRAEPLARKLTDCARQNPKLYKALRKYLDGSVYAMLAEEMAVITLSICANHGINPVESLKGLVKGLFGKQQEADGNADVSAVA